MIQLAPGMPTRAGSHYCSYRYRLGQRLCTGSSRSQRRSRSDPVQPLSAGEAEIRGDSEAATIERLIAAGTGAAAVSVQGTPVQARIRAGGSLECRQQSIHQSVRLRLYFCCVSRSRADRVGLLRLLLCFQLREAALLRRVAAVELVHGLLHRIRPGPARTCPAPSAQSSLHFMRPAIFLATHWFFPARHLFGATPGMPWAWACGTLAATKRVASPRTATGKRVWARSMGHLLRGVGPDVPSGRST